MRTTTNGVTLALRRAGLLAGAHVKVTRGRDDEHVRVQRSAGVGEERGITLLKRAEKILELSGYAVEPGLQPWYINVTKVEK